MPALNFKKQWCPLIEMGKKRQTIRPYRRDGRNPRPEQTLYLYTGMRTKACRKLGEAFCKSVEPIVIEDWRKITVGADLLGIHGKEKLAIDDGFDTLDEFMGFFLREYGVPFYGLLIKWGALGFT